jgi:chromosome segregation ATPase
VNRIKRWFLVWWRLPQVIVHLARAMQQINERDMKIMHTLQDILTEVRSQRTVITSLASLVAGLRTQVTTALANAASTQDAQAQINVIFDEAQANHQALTDALTENTAAAPTTSTDTAASTGTATGDGGSTGSTGDSGSAPAP